MAPLIARMVQDAPERRPTMDEVVAELHEIVKKLSGRKLRERLVARKDSRLESILKDLYHVSVRTVPYLLTRCSAIPTPEN